MKRIILLFILCIATIAGFTQTQQPVNPPSVKSLTNYYQLWGVLDSTQMWAPKDTTGFRAKYPTEIIGLDGHKYRSNGSGGWWYAVDGGGSAVWGMVHGTLTNQTAHQTQ